MNRTSHAILTRRTWTPSFTAACTRGDRATEAQILRDTATPTNHKNQQPPKGYGRAGSTRQGHHIRYATATA